MMTSNVRNINKNNFQQIIQKTTINFTYKTNLNYIHQQQKKCHYQQIIINIKMIPKRLFILWSTHI